ncbi:MAG: fasciclin domain-containing protein [Salinarimonas sp.]|nr:fasciclin domain-containing protein [Salinarimonas sp.]
MICINRIFSVAALTTSLLAFSATSVIAQMDERNMGAPSIGEIVSADQNFSILSEAIVLAGLEEAFLEGGPFTLFAPTNAAFERIPQTTRDALFSPQNRNQLNYILGHHVVPGSMTSVDIGTQTVTVTTAAQTTLVVEGSEGGIMVGDVAVSATDIEASNGIIHSVDMVLLPPQ